MLEDPWISKNTLSKYLADLICRLDKNVRTNVLEVGKTWPGLTLFFNQAGRRGYSSALREKSVSGGEVGLPFSQRALLQLSYLFLCKCYRCTICTQFKKNRGCLWWEWVGVGGRAWRLTAKRHKRTFWKDENLLYLDWGVCYTSVHICQVVDLYA